MKISYIPALDGIRACAFLLVFMGHAQLINAGAAAFGVTVFFFLSGFLITTLLRSEVIDTGNIQLRAFYTRRALRILPPLYATLLIAYGLGAIGLLEAGSARGFISVAGYYYNYAELTKQSSVILPTGLSVLWSLMIEEHFYLLFPVLYRALNRAKTPRRQQATLLIAVASLALAWRVWLVFFYGSPTTTYPRWTYSATDTRFDSLLWGCVLAIACNPCLGDRWSFLERHKGAFAFAGVALSLVCLAWREPVWRESVRYTVQAIALLPVFYYCVSSYPRARVRWLEWRPLRTIGVLSYSMYLAHLAILIALRQRFPRHTVLVSLGSFALVCGYAQFIRLSVETPIRRARQTPKKMASATESSPFPLLEVGGTWTQENPQVIG